MRTIDGSHQNTGQRGRLVLRRGALPAAYSRLYLLRPTADPRQEPRRRTGPHARRRGAPLLQPGPAGGPAYTGSVRIGGAPAARRRARPRAPWRPRRTPARRPRLPPGAERAPHVRLPPAFVRCAAPRQHEKHESARPWSARQAPRAPATGRARRPWALRRTGPCGGTKSTRLSASASAPGGCGMTSVAACPARRAAPWAPRPLAPAVLQRREAGPQRVGQCTRAAHRA